MSWLLVAGYLVLKWSEHAMRSGETGEEWLPTVWMQPIETRVAYCVNPQLRGDDRVHSCLLKRDVQVSQIETQD